MGAFCSLLSCHLLISFHFVFHPSLPLSIELLFPLLSTRSYLLHIFHILYNELCLLSRVSFPSSVLLFLKFVLFSFPFCLALSLHWLAPHVYRLQSCNSTIININATIDAIYIEFALLSPSFPLPFGPSSASPLSACEKP